MSKWLLLILLPLFSSRSTGQVSIPLYETPPPNSLSVPDVEKTVPNKTVDSLTYNVTNPTLTFFPAPASSSKNASIIIVPGGGYQVLLTRREGSAIAEAFNKEGYSCFVLKYRLPDARAMRNQHIVPLQDLQQAMLRIKTMAPQWKIDPDSIGVMGFSAGGHLASSMVCHFDTLLVETSSVKNLRPAFGILINPVIRFEGTGAHLGSRKNLLGDLSEQPEVVKFFSTDQQIKTNTPPCLLIHAHGDTVVPVINSLAFYMGLVEKKIPGSLVIYQQGEHGLLSAPSFSEWFNRCIYWLNNELNKIKSP